MIEVVNKRRRIRFALLRCAVGGIGLALALGGCPGGLQPPPDGGDGDGGAGSNGGDDRVVAEIISVDSSFGVSALDPPVSILYTLTGPVTDARGYYVPVADASEESPPSATAWSSPPHLGYEPGLQL